MLPESAAAPESEEGSGDKVSFREVWWQGVREVGNLVDPTRERLCEIFVLFENYGVVSKVDVQDMLLGIGLNYTTHQVNQLVRGETDLDLGRWLDRAAAAVGAQHSSDLIQRGERSDGGGQTTALRDPGAQEETRACVKSFCLHAREIQSIVVDLLDSSSSDSENTQEAIAKDLLDSSSSDSEAETDI